MLSFRILKSAVVTGQDSTSKPSINHLIFRLIIHFRNCFNFNFCRKNNFLIRAVVVVKWSACLPSDDPSLNPADFYSFFSKICA